MEKENQKSINEDKDKVQDLKDSKRSENTDSEKKELSVEEKYKELEDKLTRSYAEIENQRRRYEKEIDDAFQYGGMALAKETLNIADNLERSKLSITNDQNLDLKSKDKIIEHIDIIYKDVVFNRSMRLTGPFDSYFMDESTYQSFSLQYFVGFNGSFSLVLFYPRH